MAKPTQKPRWATTVTADPNRYVEPSSTRKDIGWDVGQHPPAQYENWLRGTTGQWIDWLDTYEDNAHTWTATQTFTPSTAVPGIVLGYNSATDTADETPSLAFKAGTKTQSVVDRLGAPSQRWLRREYMWWGAPLLLTTGAADTDVLVTGETRLWQRHSGVGPVVGSPNDFQVRVRLPEAGVAPYSFNSYRYLQQRSVFESIVDQYHVLYGDSLLVLGATFRVLVMEFTAIVVPSAADSLTAIGLMARGSDLLTGSDGRNLTTASYAFSLATANTYGNKWQVFKRNAGVTTIVDTGVSSDTYRRVRIEMVKDSSLGGPRTNVFIDGSNVYTSSTGLLTDTYLAFGSTQVPLAVGSIASMSLSPVRITALYDAI